MRSLKEIAEWFSGVRGRRKTIIYVSEGIDYDITDVIRQYDAPSNSASALIDDIRETINAAARSNVSIYAIDPRGLTDAGRHVDRRGRVRRLAAGESRRTGADATGIGLERPAATSCCSRRSTCARSPRRPTASPPSTRNDFTSAFDRIVRDNSSYYVLAYYPPHEPPRRQVPPDPGPRVAARGDGPRAPRLHRAARADRCRPEPRRARGASAAVTEALNSPIAGQRPGDARLRGAVQGHRAERVGARSASR